MPFKTWSCQLSIQLATRNGVISPTCCATACKALLFNVKSHYNAPLQPTPAALVYSANCFLRCTETASYMALIPSGILSRARAEEDEKCWQLQPLAICRHDECWELLISLECLHVCRPALQHVLSLTQILLFLFCFVNGRYV